jgi:hypothetical protein
VPAPSRSLLSSTGWHSSGSSWQPGGVTRFPVPSGQVTSTPAGLMVTLDGSTAPAGAGSSGGGVSSGSAAGARVGCPIVVEHPHQAAGLVEQGVSPAPEVAGLPHAARLGVPDRREGNAELDRKLGLRHSSSAPAGRERPRQRYPQSVRVASAGPAGPRYPQPRGRAHTACDRPVGEQHLEPAWAPAHLVAPSPASPSNWHRSGRRR